MRCFVEEYIRKKVTLAGDRPSTTVLPGNVYITGQLSEEEYKDIQKDYGIVCVLNMRPMTEVGEFGMGVLAREEEIIKGLGMQYEQIPVPKNGPYSEELTKQVTDKIKGLPRPLLLHCRTGRRVQEVIKGTELLP